MTAADYVDNLILLVHTLAQAESLLDILYQAAGSIGLYVNANKTEYMYFKQKEAISNITYLGSSISTTENDDNICWVKVWNAIDWLLIPCKSNLIDSIE